MMLAAGFNDVRRSRRIRVKKMNLSIRKDLLMIFNKISDLTNLPFR